MNRRSWLKALLAVPFVRFIPWFKEAVPRCRCGAVELAGGINFLIRNEQEWMQYHSLGECSVVQIATTSDDHVDFVSYDSTEYKTYLPFR